MMNGADQSAADLDLVEILDEAPVGSGSWAHDVIAPRMMAAASESSGSPRFTTELGDSLATVANIVQDFTGRPLGQGATWVRFRDPARSTGLLAVIHSPLALPDGGSGGEADLILVGHRGMLSRGIIRGLCRWIFYGIGLSRVVVRIPYGDTALTELARRAGFVWEGRARDFYDTDLDASVWAMSATRCRWLPSAPPSISDFSPPSSFKVH